MTVPNNDVSTRQRARALIDQDRFDEAIAFLRRAARSHPQDAQLRVLLALAHLCQGDPGAALLEARAAVKLAPQFDESHRMLSLANLALSRRAEAIVAARQAVQLRPTNHQNQMQLIDSLLHHDSALRAPPRQARAEARDLATRLLGLDPGDEDAKRALGRIDSLATGSRRVSWERAGVGVVSTLVLVLVVFAFAMNAAEKPRSTALPMLPTVGYTARVPPAWETLTRLICNAAWTDVSEASLAEPADWDAVTSVWMCESAGTPSSETARPQWQVSRARGDIAPLLAELRTRPRPTAVATCPPREEPRRIFVVDTDDGEQFALGMTGADGCTSFEPSKKAMRAAKFASFADIAPNAGASRAP